MKRSRSILKEDGMDRAQLILAAKSVTDHLQDMAEKVAKMEAEGIMPLLDGIRMYFGPEFSDRLSTDATDALRATLEAIKTTKDKIGANIQNMEQILTGTGPGNDMACQPPQATVLPDEVAEPTTDNQPDDLDLADAEASDEEVDSTTDDDAEDDVDAEEHSDDDVDGIFGADAPTGRETKESAIAKNINMLRESSDPDKMIMRYVMASLKSGKSTTSAISNVAESFGIDADAVIDIVRDFTTKDNITEGVNPRIAFQGVDWNGYDADWISSKVAGSELMKQLQTDGFTKNIDDVILLHDYCDSIRKKYHSYLAAVLVSRLSDIKEKLSRDGTGLPGDKD